MNWIRIKLKKVEANTKQILETCSSAWTSGYKQLLVYKSMIAWSDLYNSGHPLQNLNYMLIG